MFVRSDKNLPADPEYPADLAQLEYKLNDDGEFVKISDSEGPNKHFTFFITNHDRTNEVHKEATHEAVRQIIKGTLSSEFGVCEMFLVGEAGDEVAGGVKPKGKHMVVMTIDPETLKQKNDVIVVVGEPNQDMGIWAWRLLMREGGIDGGSVVGMMKKLQKLHMNKPPTDLHSSKRPAAIDPEDTLSTLARNDPALLAAAKAEKMPGIIILNPGQLHYSNAEHKCMSWATWSARKRSSAIAKGFVVDDIHNRVPGHSSPEEHIATMFDKVIPQLVREDTKLYVLGVTDGAERFINWMDASLERDLDGGIANQVHAMAFTEPTHLPSAIHEAMGSAMMNFGRAWIKSERKLGTWINSPNAMKKIHHHAWDEEDRINAEKKAAKAKAKEDEEGLKDEKDQVLVSKAGNKIKTHEFRTLIAGGEPIDILDDPAPSLARDLEHSPIKSHISNYDDDFVEMRALGESIELFRARDAARMAAGAAGAAGRAGVPVVDVQDIPGAADIDAISDRASTASSETTAPDWMSGSYDYSKRFVSVPTFSGGVADIDELLVPMAMDEVLEWFVRRSEML